jgi:flagellar P-ring protein precursor FlgI
MTRLRLALLVLFLALQSSIAMADQVRIKDLGRFLGWRDNALVGYGLVIGLAGSGDSPRSVVTQHALANVLSRLGANVASDQIQSRNVAAVLVTATLPPSANVGDRIDVEVSSIADARSLVGGTLLMTPLLGPDQHSYALAQGSLVVGGYRFDSNLNREQKNYPSSGIMPGGATVERAVQADLLGPEHELTFILNDPDVTTAERIEDQINAMLGPGAAQVVSASSVRIATSGGDVFRLVSQIESLSIDPDSPALVVINERTGTVVSGGGVQISSVVVSQGDIRVSVTLDNQGDDDTLGYAAGGRRRSLVVTNTRLVVSEPTDDAVVKFPSTTVADLAVGLARVHINTRGMIAILQAIKAAGALHADIIVQ